MCSGSSSCPTRCSTSTNEASSTALAVKAAMVTAADQAWVSALEKP